MKRQAGKRQAVERPKILMRTRWDRAFAGVYFAGWLVAVLLIAVGGPEVRIVGLIVAMLVCLLGMVFAAVWLRRLAMARREAMQSRRQ